MSNVWALLAFLSLPANPQAPAPAPQPATGQQPIAPAPQPLPGASAQGAQGAPEMPASLPALTPEQIALRLSARLTQLATRIQSLATSAGAKPTTGGTAPNPAATLEDIRAALSEIGRDVQKRAIPIETRAAMLASRDRLAARTIDLENAFKPAPEAPIINVPPPVPPMFTMPAFNPERAKDVIFTVGGVPILRGQLEEMVALRKESLPGAQDSTLAGWVLSQSLIPLATVRDHLGSKLDETMQRAQALRQEIVDGKRTFEDVAQKESIDNVTKSFGGLADGFSVQLLTDFERVALRNAKPNEVSQPFAGPIGVEIVQLVERHAEPGKAADAKYKFRRVILGYDFGVPAAQSPLELGKLLEKTEVAVLDPQYAPVLPPTIKRKAPSAPAPK